MRFSVLLGLCSACVAACGSSKDPVANPNPTTDTGVVTDTPVTASEKFVIDDGSGKPVADVNLAALDANGEILARAVSAADGMATLDGITFGDTITFIVAWKAG